MVVCLRVVSFDLDGTLVDYSFVDAVWFEGVPTLLANARGISFDEALKLVNEEYDKVGPSRLEWYDLGYWLTKFGLSEEPNRLLHRFKDRLKLYPDTLPALNKLRRAGFTLIIITSATRDFIDITLTCTNLAPFITRVFSTTSDFGRAGKDEEVYLTVLAELNLQPSDLYHIGDSRVFDFEVPRRVGVKAYLLDRSGKERGEFVVRSLEEFASKIT
jgi:FMN phosphatase YigB (HAD superfamily)